MTITFSEQEAERSRKSEIRAAEAALVRDKARANRDTQLASAADEMLNKGPNPRLDGASWDRFQAALRHAKQFDVYADLAGRAATEARQTIKITKEPVTYHAHSRHSYWADIAVRAVGPVHPQYREAEARLDRHGKEVRTDSPGRAQAVARETFRASDNQREETRAVSNSTMSFSAPSYLVSEWSPFDAPFGSFVAAGRTLPIPETGMEIHIPAFTSALSVAQQAENAGTVDTDPSTGDLGSITLRTFAGAVEMSQAMFDRAGYSGASFDEIVTAQAAQQMSAAVDAYALGQAIAGAGTVSQPTALTIALLYSSVSVAGEQLADTAGVRLPGSHAFATTDVVRWLTKQCDSSGRPIVVPDASVSVGPNTDGYTGLILPGTLKLMADDNLHTTQAATANPTYSQVLVAQASDVLTFVGSPIVFAYPETAAASLTVTVGFRCYAASIPRHSASIQCISGAGMASLS